MKLILALDQGTTSSRAILFDQEGGVRGVAQREYPQSFPKSGWVEHDPEEIWTSQITVAVEVLSRTNARPRDIVALGITNQRETTLIWDRETGQAVYNAIVWQDRRTADICDRLRRDGLENAIRSKTGLLIDAYFSATKVMWILDNVQGVRQKANEGKLAFGTVDSWLIWRLTSGHVHCIDATNASRTMFYNIRECKWDEELLQAMQIPASMLPEVKPSSGVIGRVSTTLGLGDIEIAGVAGDQQAALFGQTCFEIGQTKCTYGTGAFILQNIGGKAPESQHRLLTTVAWWLGDKFEYAMEGSIFIAGSVVQWLRDGLGIVRSSDEIEALALSVPDNGDVYFVPAFTGLGAPHWDPHARGMLIGMTRGTAAGHIARAALEGIAFQAADLLEVLERDSGASVTELRVDGGAARNDSLMQFQSDLLGIKVIRPATTETTALGAAYLAGLGAGVWKDRSEIESHWKIDKVFEPQRHPSEMRRLRERWSQALERARSWNLPHNAKGA